MRADRTHFETLRRRMVERQIAARGIHDPAVLRAMEVVPREAFVPPDLAEFAYDDAPLPIAEEQTISQPFVVAYMIEALGLREEDRVLEIGAGTGYAAAVLGEIASEVWTVERHGQLAETAKDRLQRLGYDNVHVIHADGTAGWAEAAPYDAIVVAAGGPRVPDSLKRQLAVGGRLVIPVGPTPRSQHLVRLRKTAEGRIEEDDLGGVRFVPLLGAEGWETDSATTPGAGPTPVSQVVRECAEPFDDIDTADLDAFLERVGDARVVLLGGRRTGRRSSTERVDPGALQVAHARYGCLTPWQSDPAVYGRAAATRRFEDCEEEVTAMLSDLLERRLEYVRRDGEDYFDAVQNARLVKDAEQYYRAMYRGRHESWNLRDGHMFDCLQAVLKQHGPDARAVVWAHNSHLGDAAATEMAVRGELNLGQLCRREYGNRAYLVGFGTDHGTVAAAHAWDGPMHVMDVPPAREDSYEHICHETATPAFFLPLRDPARPELREELWTPRLERFIGVLYRPEIELASHYMQARLPAQFDEWIWFDRTRAVERLAPVDVKTEGLPDTYPFGL